MQSFLSACAKRDRGSQAEYGRVWDALVSCTEGILGSGRGAVIEQLGTVTFLSRPLREEAPLMLTRHQGCAFIANSKFIRTFNLIQCAPPQKSSLLTPVVRLSQARIGYAAGVDNDRARVVLASIFDAIGRKACSGAKLRLAFGSVGSLVAKDRTLTFAFGRGFRRAKSDSRTGQDEYDDHVRRILADIETRKSSNTTSTLSGGTARSLVRPETCPATPLGRAGTQSNLPINRTPLPTREGSPRPRKGGGGAGGGGAGKRHGDDDDGALPPSIASHRSALAGGGGGDGRSSSRPAASVTAVAREHSGLVGGGRELRPGTAAAAVGDGGRSAHQAHSGQEPHRRSSNLRRASSARGVGVGVGRLDERRPETPTPRSMVAGAAAIVAGGRMGRGSGGATVVGEKRGMGTGRGGRGRGAGRGGGRAGVGVDVSPRTANKVLPHFLAIGNPGSQALVPKEGAEIVRRQAMARFDRMKKANLLLDEKEDQEMRQSQVARWAEYEERHTKERARLKEYLAAVSAQAEAQRAARAQSKNAEFLSRNPDPNRAYPCRTEYNPEKEATWRRGWCNDLEAQIDLKQALATEAKCAEASRDRVRAAQLDAAIKADRRREAQVKRLDRDRINRAWETQVASFARAEGGGKRTQSFILDKIVR